MTKHLLIFLLALVAGKAQADPFLIQNSTGNFREQLPLVRNYLQQAEHQRTILTAGRISQKSFIEYQGNFDRYLGASIKTRRGKVYEEVFATAMNLSESNVKRATYFVPTAAIKSPQNPIDVVSLNKNGQAVEKFQLKMSGTEARAALNNPKYIGQTIVIPNDQIDYLKNELLKRQANAARRGITLPAEWVNLEKALESGKLTGFSTTNEINTKAIEFLKKEWGNFQGVEAGEKAIAQAILSSEKAEAQALAKSVGGLSKLQILGKCIILSDYALNSVAFASELNSFMNNDLDGGVFAGKTTLKALQFYLGYAALADPEPISKTATIALVLAIAAADLGLDAINLAIIEPRKAYVDRILSEIEPRQRGMVARNQLLEIYKSDQETK